VRARRARRGRSGARRGGLASGGIALETLRHKLRRRAPASVASEESAGRHVVPDNSFGEMSGKYHGRSSEKFLPRLVPTAVRDALIQKTCYRLNVFLKQFAGAFAAQAQTLPAGAVLVG
jgi:hypothetical protein